MDEVVVGSFSGLTIPPPGCAVLAAGGYGRGTLHPGSDLDFLILFRSAAVDASVRQVVEAIGDPGFEVGFQSLDLAAFDRFDPGEVEGYAAFFDSRFLVGDRGLAQEFTDVRFPEFVSRNRVEFLMALIRSRQERLGGWETPSQPMEPDLKFGPGGLRDYHFVRWVAAIVGGVVPERVEEAVGLLYRIRNFLHYLAARNENTLLRQFQGEIAERLGYRSAADLLEARRSAASTILASADEAAGRAQASVPLRSG